MTPGTGPESDGPPYVRFVGSGPSARDAIASALIRGAFRVMRALSIGRGHYTVCRAVGRLASAGGFVEFEMVGGGRFRVHPADGYWMRPLLVRRQYETELRHVVEFAVDSGLPFLDCGANLGWWSVFAGHRAAGAERVLAVEASPSTYRGLTANAVLNDRSFRHRNAAVWSRSGEQLDFVEARESAASGVAQTRPAGGSPRGLARVETASLDELLGSVGADAGPVLCKLDVEGAELEVLGASGMLPSGAVALIYEDHGQDREDTVSRWLLDNGYRLYSPTNDGALVPLADRDAVRACKGTRYWGFNFVAWAPDGVAETAFSSLVRSDIGRTA